MSRGTARSVISKGRFRRSRMRGSSLTRSNIKCGAAVLQSQIVSACELSENFCFPQHHRIQSAGDLEEVMDALRFGQPVDFITQRIAIVVDGDVKLLELGKGAARIHERARINLDPIT